MMLMLSSGQDIIIIRGTCGGGGGEGVNRGSSGYVSQLPVYLELFQNNKFQKIGFT